MQSHIPEIRSQGAEVAAISVDSPEDNKRLLLKRPLEFPLLSDPNCSLIDQLGLRHRAAGPHGEDISLPAVFILDREGKIAWHFQSKDARERLRPEMIVEQLKAIR